MRLPVIVYHSNLGPILHRFRDIVGFVLMTQPLLQPNFGLDRAHVGASPSTNR